MVKLVKEKLIENIRELLKQRGIKIGDLEQKIGVSPGYFSRILKEGRDIPIEHIIAVAAILQVSIDNLLFGDFLPRYNGENRICEYLDKVILDAQNGKSVWKKGAVNKFEDNEKDIISQFNTFLRLDYDISFGGINDYYRGKYKDNRELLLLNVVIKEGQKEGWILFVIYWRKIFVGVDIEEDYGLEPDFIDICCTLRSEREVLQEKVQQLIECIEKCMKDIPISIETQAEIDAFLNE